MLDKLQNLDDKYEELGRMLADPEVLANPEELRKTAKARADLEDVVMAWRAYRKADEELADAKVMLADDLDDDMAQMVKEEIKTLSSRSPPFLRRHFSRIKHCIFCIIAFFSGGQQYPGVKILQSTLIKY